MRALNAATAELPCEGARTPAGSPASPGTVVGDGDGDDDEAAAAAAARGERYEKRDGLRAAAAAKGSG